jgi:prefoldin subunit 5
MKYHRDKLSGALIINDPEKEKEILFKRNLEQQLDALREEINQLDALREEINTLKKKLDEILAKRN